MIQDEEAYPYNRPRLQQEITTTIDRDDGDFVVDVHAAPALDDELRSAFHDAIDTLGNENVSVQSRTRKSNQGNELFQIVTLRFNPEDQLAAIDILAHVIEIGKDHYYSQLERDLGREGEEASNLEQAKQQLYFEDDEVKEFCLLFRGRMDDF